MVTKVDLKVVVLGKECVGKTALVDRFLNGNFQTTSVYQPTIGAAYGARQLKNSDNIPIIMGVWDTAGSERYQSMTRMYYRGAKAAILCFDLTDSISFNKINYWYRELRDAEPHCAVFLCGCKKDLIGANEIERAISPLAINDFAQNVNAKYFETSSKTGEGISELFQLICNDITENPGFISDTLKKNIELNKSPKTESINCKAC